MLSERRSVVSDSLRPHGTIQSMESSGPKYWGREPFPSPGDLPDPGIEPRSPSSVGGFFASRPPGKLFMQVTFMTLQVRRRSNAWSPCPEPAAPTGAVCTAARLWPAWGLSPSSVTPSRLDFPTSGGRTALRSSRPMPEDSALSEPRGRVLQSPSAAGTSRLGSHPAVQTPLLGTGSWPYNEDSLLFSAQWNHRCWDQGVVRKEILFHHSYHYECLPNS